MNDFHFLRQFVDLGRLSAIFDKYEDQYGDVQSDLGINGPSVLRRVFIGKLLDTESFLERFFNYPKMEALGIRIQSRTWFVNAYHVARHMEDILKEKLLLTDREFDDLKRLWFGTYMDSTSKELENLSKSSIQDITLSLDQFERSIKKIEDLTRTKLKILEYCSDKMNAKDWGKFQASSPQTKDALLWLWEGNAKEIIEELLRTQTLQKNLIEGELLVGAQQIKIALSGFLLSKESLPTTELTVNAKQWIEAFHNWLLDPAQLPSISGYMRVTTVGGPTTRRMKKLEEKPPQTSAASPSESQEQSPEDSQSSKRNGLLWIIGLTAMYILASSQSNSIITNSTPGSTPSLKEEASKTVNKEVANVILNEKTEEDKDTALKIVQEGVDKTKQGKQNVYFSKVYKAFTQTWGDYETPNLPAKDPKARQNTSSVAIDVLSNNAMWDQKRQDIKNNWKPLEIDSGINTNYLATMYKILDSKEILSEYSRLAITGPASNGAERTEAFKVMGALLDKVPYDISLDNQNLSNSVLEDALGLYLIRTAGRLHEGFSEQLTRSGRQIVVLNAITEFNIFMKMMQFLDEPEQEKLLGYRVGEFWRQHTPSQEIESVNSRYINEARRILKTLGIIEEDKAKIANFVFTIRTLKAPIPESELVLANLRQNINNGAIDDSLPLNGRVRIEDLKEIGSQIGTLLRTLVGGIGAIRRQFTQGVILTEDTAFKLVREGLGISIEQNMWTRLAVILFAFVTRYYYGWGVIFLQSISKWAGELREAVKNLGAKLYGVKIQDGINFVRQLVLEMLQKTWRLLNINVNFSPGNISEIMGFLLKQALEFIENGMKIVRPGSKPTTTSSSSATPSASSEPVSKPVNLPVKIELSLSDEKMIWFYLLAITESDLGSDLPQQMIKYKQESVDVVQILKANINTLNVYIEKMEKLKSTKELSEAFHKEVRKSLNLKILAVIQDAILKISFQPEVKIIPQLT